MPLPTEGFLLEYAPGRLVVGEGPLEASAARDPERLACYAPDFLLADAAPWLHPTAWHETTREDWGKTLGPAAPPAVTWQEPDAAAYAERFAAVMQRIRGGPLVKAVPVVLEHGAWHAPASAVTAGLLRRVLSAPGPSHAYALWTPSAGMVGASPEILFVRHRPEQVETVAMAGTVPTARATALPDDPKETREQAAVVEDIVAALTPLGDVVVGARDVLRLPTMVHLKSDITATLTGTVDFMELVRALHPTAALGVAPRLAGQDLLPTLGPAARGRFGAPFGVEWPDGRAHVVVAIRNVQWTGTEVTLGAGAGLIAESRLEHEWEELQLKRAAVKGLLGL
jgi:menaquinone-specific isochorismate synthase